MDGKAQKLSEVLQKDGAKGTWVTIWDVTCPDCMSDLPKMEQTFKNLQKKVLEWVGVAIKTTPEKATQFTEKNGLTFLSLLDPDKKVTADLKVAKTPYTLLLDPNRKVMAAYQGTNKEILAAKQKDAEEFLTEGKVTSEPIGSGKG